MDFPFTQTLLLKSLTPSTGHSSSTSTIQTMLSAATVVGVLGTLLFTVLSPCKADIYPGDGAFQDICQEIIDDVAANAIPFRHLVTICGGWWGCTDHLQVYETLTRQELCDRLTNQHNTNNALYLGGATVSSSECQAALLAPLFYTATEWNNWSGRHCGTWRSTDASGTVTQTFTDNALWNTAVPSSSVGFVTQSVTFLTRPGTCCDDAWNESGGLVSQTAAVKCLIQAQPCSIIVL